MYTYLKSASKKCRSCKLFFPLEEFGKASPSMMRAAPNSYADGKDIYCKPCKSMKGSLGHKLKKFNQAINFWKLLSSSTEMANLAYLDAYAIPGMASWPQSISSTEYVPGLVYCNFALVNRHLWNIYAHAFNYLYCYDRANLRKPNPHSREQLRCFASKTLKQDLLNPVKRNIDGTTLNDNLRPFLRIKKDYEYYYQYGIHKRPTKNTYLGICDVIYNYNKVKHMNKAFFRYKKCTACHQIKQTYRNPSNVKSDDPIPNDVYAKKLWEVINDRMCRYTLYSHSFKQSYASVTKMGWIARCIECSKGDYVKAPKLWNGYNASAIKRVHEEDTLAEDLEQNLKEYDKTFTLLD